MINTLILAVSVSSAVAGYEFPKGLQLIDETKSYASVIITHNEEPKTQQEKFIDALYKKQMKELHPNYLNYKIRPFYVDQHQVTVLKNGIKIDTGEHNLMLYPIVDYMDRNEK